jgi:TetR/AcrR family transcriptional regulator
LKEADGTLNDSMYRIRNAAEALFARHGYSGVSVKEISAAANANISAVSYYFGGKEGLYTSIMERHAQKIKESLQEISATDASPLEKIHCLAERITNIRRSNPNFNGIWSFALISCESGGSAEEVIGKIRRFLEECVTEASKNGECNLVIRPHLIDILLHNTLLNCNRCEAYNFFSELDVFHCR